MVATLERRGFEVRRHIDGDATRSGIIAAYERLIAETPVGSTEPVVVYYSGHGGRNQLDDAEERARRGAATHLHFIVPFDMDSSSESDFRGILAQELSDLQRRLTERTSNVTTILDCCHSGTMSRDPSIMPKAVSRGFSVQGARSWLDEFEARQRTAPAAFDTSNQLAVRVVACDPSQSAYERTGADGRRHGALTEQLAAALEGLGERPVSWSVIGERIRRSIATTLPMQRPEIEGPADRVVFSLRSRTWTRALPVTVSGGTATIEAARLLGVSQGDTYSLVAEDETKIGAATVARVEGDRAELEATEGSVATAVSAVPTRTHDAQPVRLDVAGAVAELVDTAVQRFDVAAAGRRRAAAGHDLGRGRPRRARCRRTGRERPALLARRDRSRQGDRGGRAHRQGHPPAQHDVVPRPGRRADRHGDGAAGDPPRWSAHGAGLGRRAPLPRGPRQRDDHERDRSNDVRRRLRRHAGLRGGHAQHR